MLGMLSRKGKDGGRKEGKGREGKGREEDRCV